MQHANNCAGEKAYRLNLTKQETEKDPFIIF